MSSDSRRLSLHIKLWRSISEGEHVTSPMREQAERRKTRAMTGTPSKQTPTFSTSPISNYVDITNSRIFGVHISDALSRAPDEKYGTVPAPLRNAIDFLNQSCIEEQGLYRIPGNKRVLEQYREEFDRGEIIDFLNDHITKSRIHEAHDVCGLIRLFWTTLAEPIFTDRLFTAFQLKEFSPDPDNPDEVSAKVDRLKFLVEQLPNANREALRLFIKHLNLITQHSKTNMMTAKNLVISLFGMAPHSRCYYLLIVHCDKIFAAEDIAAPKSARTLSPVAAGADDVNITNERQQLGMIRVQIEQEEKKQEKKMSALRRASVRLSTAFNNVMKWDKNKINPDD